MTRWESDYATGNRHCRQMTFECDLGERHSFLQIECLHQFTDLNRRTSHGLHLILQKGR